MANVGPGALVAGAWQRLWPALGFCAAALILYGPALNRVFVDDQIWYFAELDGSTSLVDGLRHYDYAATRQYWKGDDALFRPLLFVWLAVGNSLFAYHHVWWNVANAVLHGLVVFCLFRLLTTIRRSSLALGAAVLFLVMKPSMELVVWNHLGGYLLACICLMVGTRAFVQLTGRPDCRPSASALVTYALAFTAASLFYEAMAVMALLAGLVALGVERRRWRRPGLGVVLAAALPVTVYSILYAGHLLKVERFSYVDRPDVGHILGAESLVSAALLVPEVIGRWTLEVMVPSAVRLQPMAFVRFVKQVSFSWLDPGHLASAALCSALAVVLVRSVGRRHVKQNLPLLTLLCGAVLSYVAIICVGRPGHEVLAVSYYLYVFGLLLIAIAYTLFDPDAFPSRGGVPAALALAGLIVLNAAGTRSVASQVGRVNSNASSYLATAVSFVDEHKAEPDFSFAISPQPPDVDPEITLRKGYPDDAAAAVRSVRLTEILFARYYNRKSPKYVIRGR